ncbi:sensor histidine kinase [Flexistipes sinusarabici]|uniref:sensor histidine kinase n=1 Tax=Flexistipes sinusarabici TaxID=2352 RepID=UPI0023551328|nr:HAMP domain-containing sensor histidine kinase [Flexistipes sinusarabici]
MRKIMRFLSVKGNNKPADHILKPIRIALLIGATYIVLAGIYIIYSSQYAAKHARTVEALELTEMQKGLIFVIVTGIILIIVLRWVFQEIAHKEKKIIDQRNALLISERHAVAGMLASSVAHDINNVLTTLIATVDILKNEIDGSETSQKHLDRLQEANEHLISLTKRLSRVGKAHLVSETQKFDLCSVLEEAVSFSKTHKDVKTCHLNLDCPGGLIVSGFPDMLHQMIFNLILNSAQASGEGGRIDIAVDSGKNQIRLELTDNGPGIPEDKKDNIFQPFYTTKETGTGLGMLSIQACVEAHNGSIKVGESESGGARFTIILPRKSS